MSLSHNKLYDEFQIVEVEHEVLRKPLEITALDYIILVLGARDYDYLINENRFRFDNDITSLYPVCSYNMLHFIIFLLSKLDPVVNHLFDFQKDKTFGVYSKVFYDTVEALHKKYPLPSTEHTAYGRKKGAVDVYYDNEAKHIAYNLNNREFSFLRLHANARILQHYFSSYPVKQDMLYVSGYTPKLKPKMKDLTQQFNIETLLYLPRFYFNIYSRFLELTNKTASIDRMARMKDSRNPYEFNNPSVSSFTRVDMQKLYLSLGVDIPTIVSNMKKLGIETTNDRIISILFTKEREEPITDIYELNEFMIKCILLRRNPSAPLNTSYDRTNGIYLLNRGIARLRELTIDELFIDHVDRYNYVRVQKTYVTLKGRRVGIKDIVDLDNKPYLLNQKFIDFVNIVYDKHPVHRLLKFAETYVRLFNHFGDNIIWFMLGTELEDQTNFKYSKFLANYDLIKGKYYKIPYAFKKFEDLIYGNNKKLKSREFGKVLKNLYRTPYYSKEKGEFIAMKFKTAPYHQETHP